MSRFDDDRVIALLREAVPPTPEVPADRLVGIRARAGRQRAAMWTQALGAVATVLLIVGVASALSTGADQDRVDPTDRPLKAVADALLRQKSVRFEAVMTPVGDLSDGAHGMSSAELRDLLTAHLTGAATSDGDLQMRGDMSFATLLGDETGTSESELRYVDGVAYHTVGKGMDVPAGKRWIRSGGEAPDGGVQALIDTLRKAESFAGNIRYVGPATVRGVEVAEYRLTIPERYAGQRIDVTFALDAEDRLRRIAAQFSYRDMLGGGVGYEVATPDGPVEATSDPRPDVTPPSLEGAVPLNGLGPPRQVPTSALMVRVEAQFFGYGEDVVITAPPAAEVISDDELYAEERAEQEAVQRQLDDCLEKAAGDEQREDCFRDASVFWDSHSGFGSGEMSVTGSAAPRP